MRDRAAYTSSCPVCFMVSKNSLNVAKSRDTTVLPFYILLRIPLCIVRCPVTETVPVRSQTALFLQRPSSRLPRRHPKLPFEGTDKRRFMLKATVICDIADPFLRIVQQFSGFLELLSSDILRQRNAIILLKYRLQIVRRQVDMLCNLLNGICPLSAKVFVGIAVVSAHSNLLSVTTAPCFKRIVAWCCDTRKKMM